MVGGQVKKRVCSCKYLIYGYILKLYSYNFINTCCNITYSIGRILLNGIHMKASYKCLQLFMNHSGGI